MNDDRARYSPIGFSFPGVLTIVFIVLKLCKVIDWSWLWVLSPLWISVGIGLILVVALLLFLWRK